MERTSSAKGSRQRPVEDIDAILGKFSAWSSSQQQPEKHARDRVSEISYEKALQAMGGRTGANRILAKEENSKPLAATQVAVADPWEKAGTESPQKPRGRSEKGKRRERGTATVSTSRSRQKAVASEPKSARCRSDDGKPDAPKTSFAEIVQQKVALMQEASVLQGRSVSLTVRLAPAESAMVKSRAAEANISVSAYVRQCTLEVDKLRAQVGTALAELHSAQITASSPDRTSFNCQSAVLPPPADSQRSGLGLFALGLRALRMLWGKRGFERVA